VRIAVLTGLLLAASVARSVPPEPAVDVDTSAAEIVAKCSEGAATDIVGLRELDAACPGLEHALVQLGYAPFVSEAQLDALTVHGLVDLQQLADRYRQPPDVAANPIEVTTLGPILESLRQEQRAELPDTWFQRLKRWLRSVFDRPQQDSDSWLSRWLQERTIPEKVRDGIINGLILLVIALAVAVVFNEARAAGLLRRGGRRSSRMPDRAAGPEPRRLSLADLDSAAPEERPSLLLRLLVATLVDAGRLRTEKSLTHRELSQRADFDAADQRENFQRVAVLGERLLYGDARVAPDEIEAAVEAGRALNAQLAAPKGSS